MKLKLILTRKPSKKQSKRANTSRHIAMNKAEIKQYVEDLRK